MTAILRAALLAALAAPSIPAVAAGQDTSTANLLRRPVPASANWRDLANWRRLRRGMNMDQVRDLLGEPERVEAGLITHWCWADANVYFVEGKLDGWSEPRR